MMNAYDRMYLEKAKNTLGCMLDFAVNDLDYDLSEFWNMFTSSYISKMFEMGDVSIIAGRSGYELALMVASIYECNIKSTIKIDRSEEYWLGFAICSYQYEKCISFKEITDLVSIEDIKSMYNPYHEMDIRHFIDKLDEIRFERKKKSNLKKRRMKVGLSQQELSDATGIPIRTIQQYEQRQKNINNAKAEYVIALSRALYCEPILLLEK